MIIQSVNVGAATAVPWGSLKRSAIDKRPVDRPTQIKTLGLRGDEIADLVFHGGPDKAVYAFAREDLDEWSASCGTLFGPGTFGENLTTSGIDLNEVRIGDRWRVGTALIEAACVRIPCSVFQGFVGQDRWVKRFTERGRPGVYFRVIEEGVVSAGDPIAVVERRAHDLTIGYLFRARTTDRSLLPHLLAEPRISEATRKAVQSYESAVQF